MQFPPIYVTNILRYFEHKHVWHISQIGELVFVLFMIEKQHNRDWMSAVIIILKHNIHFFSAAGADLDPVCPVLVVCEGHHWSDSER